MFGWLSRWLSRDWLAGSLAGWEAVSSSCPLEVTPAYLLAFIYLLNLAAFYIAFLARNIEINPEFNDQLDIVFRRNLETKTKDIEKLKGLDVMFVYYDDGLLTSP